MFPLLFCMLSAAVSVPPASACTVCDGSTAKQVRAQIVDEDVARNLLATALPFPVLLAVVAAIHFAPPRRKPPRPPTQTNDQR